MGTLVQRTIDLWSKLSKIMFCVYFLRSVKNNKVYVGYTSKEPTQRLSEHNIGTNSWTSANKPFNLIYFEEYICKEDAIKRERFYKMGFGKKIKQAIIGVLGT